MSEPLLAAIARSARGSAPAIVPRIVSRFEPLPEALFGEDDLTDEASWDEMKLVAPDVDEFTGVARLLRSFGQDTIGGGTRPERGDLDEAIEGDDVHVGRSDEARRAPSAGPRAIAPAKRDAVPGKTIASVAARDADVGAGFAPRVSPAPHAPDEPPQPIVEDAIVGGDADASTPEGATSSDGARASDAAPSAIQHDLPFAEEGHRGDVRAGFATPITSAPLAPDETTEVRHRPENAASVDGSTPEGAASNGGASPAPPVPAREYADDAFVAWSDGARASDAPPSAIQHDLPFAEEGPPLQNGAVRDDASVVGDEVSGAHRGDVHAGFAAPIRPASRVPDGTPEARRRSENAASVDASRPEGATSGIGASFASPVPSREHADDAFVSRSDGARVSDAPSSAAERDLPFAEERRPLQNGAVRDDASVVGDVRAGSASPITPAPPVPERTPEIRRRPENAAAVDASTPEGATSKGGGSPSSPIPSREHVDDAFVSRSDGVRVSDAPSFAAERDLPFAEGGPPLQNGAVRDDASIVGDEVSAANRGDVHAGFASPITPASRVPDGTPEVRRRPENAASDAPPSAAERDLPLAEEGRSPQNGAVQDDVSVVGADRTREVRRQSVSAASVEASDASTPEGATSSGGASPSSPVPSREHVDDAFVVRSDG
ncbi:MAG TPA: hypothetical protein VMA36_20325, partial [Candidatus Limnocylindria bacterium]|nr:hypothetical protein [Candidatus Limnocylindria bacterium]